MSRRVGMAVCLLVCLGTTAPAAAFERTEERVPCADRSALRRPFFGDLHVHTTFSYDANTLGVRNTPADAYRFARGEMLGIQPYDALGNPRRQVQLRRPLDFAAVTDHAELLGEVHICSTPGVPGHDSLMCRINRRWPLLAYLIINSGMLNYDAPVRYSLCGPDGARCREAGRGPWKAIQRAAEEAYDRTAACRFTTFVAYEYSGNPFGDMIHRNVVFRNATVQDYPTSYVETRTERELWETLRAECLDRDDGCDVLAIPHNSNVSGGALFPIEDPDGEPIDATTAALRARMEPVIEITQHKGTSECRGATPFSEDELCDFEQLPFARMDEFPFERWWSEPPPLSYTREILGEGLVQEARLGVNPFKLGIIGSTDSHLGTPGLTDEDVFPGHGAGGDTTRVEIPRVPDRLFFNPGGLAVIWAEENSRDALFSAMRRREVYATSGPRLEVRFFGGWEYAADVCGEAALPASGYAGGVPMGGDLPPRPPAGTPRFILQAAADAGDEARGTVGLGRMQIVKVWLEDGVARERVFDVAGAPSDGPGVDPATCRSDGSGAPRFCTTWHDPEFDPAAPALYYARVLERPSCRWSTHTCLEAQVRCDAPPAVPADLAYCCDAETPRTIEERAWTSPIWYRPAGGPGNLAAVD